MRKIHFKIITLVLICLLLLGISMSLISILELRSLGSENITTLDTKLREDFDRMAKSQVESAVSIIRHYYDQRDILGEEAAMETARQAVIAMRYGTDGYIFIYDSKGETIALLGSDTEGTNRWDLKDEKNNYPVRDIIKTSMDGTGYTTYWYSRPGATEASPKRAYNQYFKAWDWIVGTGNYIDDIDAIIDEERHHLSSTIRSNIIFIIIADLIVMLGAIAFSWFMGKRISRPVEQLATEARKVASGDMTVEMSVKSRDETADLADAFNEMINRMNYTLNDIVRTAQEINFSSAEISDSSQQVATGASEQASSAEEISASMEELSSNIQQNTENSRHSNAIVSKAAEDADAGGKAVEETVESIKFISEKISIIEEIARSTNMLALNAAIEAARAGEAGKGFSVVAAEVKKLAESSQKAAAEITQISAEGVKKAETTRALMVEMVPVIKKSADISEEIKASSDEQARGAEQVNSALMEMDKVIQSNASASEEIAAMTEELKSKSDNLNRLVSFFKIRTDGNQTTLREKRPVKAKPVPAPSEKPSLPSPEPEFTSDQNYGDFEEF